MKHPISTDEANFISEACVTVIRDRMISSLYGRECHHLGVMHGVTLASTIFSQSTIDALNMAYGRYGINFEEISLYSGIGDLYSQLARLLIACRETPGLRHLIDRANEKIAGLIICPEIYAKENHIRHLRNSVCHGNVTIELDSNPFQAQVVFIDKRKNGTETARYSMTSDQLAKVIDIILADVLLAFLRQIGWSIGSSE